MYLRGEMKLLFLLTFLFFSATLTCFALEVYFTPSRDCENAIIKRLRSAKKIDIAIYTINNRLLVKEIKKAYDRGAAIRLISDIKQAAKKTSKIKELKAYGISVALNEKKTTEHNKFAVFDGITVVTGSYNWTNAATYRNSENCVFFEDDEQKYQSRFNFLWKTYNSIPVSDSPTMRDKTN